MMRIIVLLAISMLIFACEKNSNVAKVAIAEQEQITEVAENIVEENQESTIEAEAAPLPPPIPLSEKRKENEKKESLKSVFLNLGCCDQEGSRTDDCCCFAVLEKYKKLHSSKDPKLGDYKMNDPILGNCRRKMAKEFETIDYPKVEEPEEEEEDLF